MQLPEKQQNEVKQQAIELFELEKKFKAISKTYQEKKSKLSLAIKNFMYCTKGANEEFSFEQGDILMRVKKITPTTIVWDPDKLEERLDKEVREQVIEKRYTVEDMPGLIKYLKSCGVDPKVFKSFIAVEKKVCTEALEQLEALGEITREDVAGCYRVEVKTSYLRIGSTEGRD